MAIHRSALKRARQDKKRNLANNSVKSASKTAVKKVQLAIKEENAEAAKAGLNKAFSLLEKAANKRILHKNTAARKKSKLSRATNSLLAKIQSSNS